MKSQRSVHGGLTLCRIVGHRTRRRSGHRIAPSPRRHRGGSRILPRNSPSPNLEEGNRWRLTNYCTNLCARTAGVAACAALVFAAMQPRVRAAWPHASRPLAKVLPRFTAPDVPEMGPAETPVPPRKPESLKPIPPGLPGKGLAQHPMLYIGEGYNKIFLVNHGKIVWTYSTGPGWEYDDVWMLSNGNILFTRMQYVAEITPDKKVVWRYDAPAGHRNPHLPAHRSGQGHVYPKRPAAQADGGEHQDQRGRGESCAARAQLRQVACTGSSVACATRHREPIWLLSWNEPSCGIRQGLQRDLELRHQESLGRHPPKEWQHSDHRRARCGDARSEPEKGDSLGAEAERSARSPTDIPTPSPPRAWPTATPSSAREAARQKARNWSKSLRTRRWSGCSRIGWTWARQRPCKFSTIPAFPSVRVIRNTEAAHTSRQRVIEATARRQ